MQSSYVPLNQYYRNQFNSREQYGSSSYNVGKFELSRSTDSPALFRVSQVDPSISKTTEYSQWSSDISFDAENIPLDADIKSVDVFMRFGDNMWAPSVQPFIQQSLTYDKSTKKISISKPNNGVFLIQSKPAPFASPTCNRMATTTPCLPFVRIYITWG